MLKLATKFAPSRASLERARAAGFRHAELFLDQAILADWQAVAAQTQDVSLTYALHFPNSLGLSAEAVEAAVALYDELACRCMVIHQPMFDKFHKVLLARQPNLRLAIENHKLTPEGLQTWAEQSPGLALDVEHLWKFTLRDGPLASLLQHLEVFLAQHRDKLLHVHLPGYWPGMDEHRPLYCAREMVFPVLSLLEQARFEGLIVSEVNQAFQNPFDLRMDTLLFESWRSQH